MTPDTPSRQPKDRGTVQPFPFEHEDLRTPARQPQDPADVLFICSLEDLNCLHDYIMAAMAGDDISELPRLWNQQIGVIRSRPHTSPPAPAKTPQECENRNCLDCPLWEQCHIMDEMPMCARATYDGVRKNAAKAVREQVLNELMQWCNDNWHGAFIVQYEKQLTEQVVDLVRLKAMIKSLRAQQEQP